MQYLSIVVFFGGIIFLTMMFYREKSEKAKELASLVPQTFLPIFLVCILKNPRYWAVFIATVLAGIGIVKFS